MKAVVLAKANGPLVVVDDHPAPNNSAGETIDVLGCGVCHSDLHVVDGVFGGSLPMILGHEVTGHHHQMGPVIVYAPWGCRSCRQCEEGLEMMCARATEAGLFADGGYAEQMWIKDRRYLAPLGDLDPIAAAPLACGGLTAYRAVKHGLERLRAISSGGRALVITPHEAQLMSSVWGSRTELDELLEFAHREPQIVQPVEAMPLNQAQIAHNRLRKGDVEGRIVLVPDRNED